MQVIARTVLGFAARICPQRVVFPPPDGAEMRISNEFDTGSDMRAYSTFCTCSRNFSNSAFITTTSREMTLSLAFEPTVLTSRFIS